MVSEVEKQLMAIGNLSRENMRYGMKMAYEDILSQLTISTDIDEIGKYCMRKIEEQNEELVKIENERSYSSEGVF